MSDEKPKWLVVYPSGGGMAELNNVFVVVADDKATALRIAHERAPAVRDARMWAARLDELHDGWAYFT